jgi:hypothetical protein
VAGRALDTTQHFARYLHTLMMGAPAGAQGVLQYLSADCAAGSLAASGQPGLMATRVLILVNARAMPHAKQACGCILQMKQ